MEEWMYSSKHS